MEKKKSGVAGLRQQLTAAIVMVLVAAIALGSATYAWFAGNLTVSATGMSLTAQTEGIMLVISKTEAGLEDQDTTIDLELEGTDMLPTHPITGDYGTATDYSDDITAIGNTISAWHHRFSNATDSALPSGDSAKDETLIASADYAKYFKSQVIYIGLASTTEGEATEDVVIDGVTFTWADDDPDDETDTMPDYLTCARLAVCGEDGKLIGVFAPDGKYVSTMGVQDESDTLSAYSSISSKYSVISALNNGDPSTFVTVYYYFDGRDANCTTDNFSAEELCAISCSISFSTTEDTSTTTEP